ncbi:hypothetical protein ASD51_31775 [Streptomyces sp. Root55]|nr:hypothetical protein ASD51_31775 [Streptomyces sp. Root55]
MFWDDEAGAGGRCLFGFGADLGLPPFLDFALQARGEVFAGLLDLVFHVAFDGALGDSQHLGDGPGAFVLLDEVAHLGAGRLGDGAGEGPLHRLVETV